MKSNHTPGPWKFKNWHPPVAWPGKPKNATMEHHISAAHPTDARLCVPIAHTSAVHDKTDGETTKANARLIAAAPELLDVLNSILYAHESPPGASLGEARLCEHFATRARAAINKATGNI